MAQRHLDPTIARHVRELVAGGHATPPQIAEDIGCSARAIQAAVRGDTWKDAGGPIRRSGAGQGRRVLTVREVREILEDPRCSPEVAEDHGVSEALIRHIRTGRVWRHVPRPARMPEWPVGKRGADRGPRELRA